MAQMRVLGVLAGNDTPSTTIMAWAADADLVVAADGAANPLLQAGVRIDAVIGDMDSIDPLLARSQVEFLRDENQENTDCDKLMLHLRSRCPGARVAIAGIEGDRFDHVLASIHSIARWLPEAQLILRDGFGWFVNPDLPVEVESYPGQTLSLIPLLPCGGVSMTGVRWPPASELAPLGATSISNEADGMRVAVSIRSGSALFVQRGDSSKSNWL